MKCYHFLFDYREEKAKILLKNAIWFKKFSFFVSESLCLRISVKAFVSSQKCIQSLYERRYLSCSFKAACRHEKLKILIKWTLSYTKVL